MSVLNKIVRTEERSLLCTDEEASVRIFVFSFTFSL